MPSLAKTVVDYASAHETHSRLEQPSYLALRTALEHATMAEILEQNNMLTIQDLWRPASINLFYNEVRARLLRETNFRLATSWVRDWSPRRATLTLTFADDLPVVVPVDGWIGQQGRVVSMTNPEFLLQVVAIAVTPGARALVQTSQNNPDAIVGVENGETIAFESPDDAVRAPIDRQVSAEWAYVYGMYRGLKTGAPAVSDPSRANLINQMVDLSLAERIDGFGGVTHEGDHWMDVDARYPAAKSVNCCQ